MAGKYAQVMVTSRPVDPPRHAVRSAVALALAEDLLDRGHLEMGDLLDASRTTGCTRLMEVLFRRLGH